MWGQVSGFWCAALTSRDHVTETISVLSGHSPSPSCALRRSPTPVLRGPTLPLEELLNPEATLQCGSNWRNDGPPTNSPPADANLLKTSRGSERCDVSPSSTSAPLFSVSSPCVISGRAQSAGVSVGTDRSLVAWRWRRGPAYMERHRWQKDRDSPLRGTPTLRLSSNSSRRICQSEQRGTGTRCRSQRICR